MNFVFQTEHFKLDRLKNCARDIEVNVSASILKNEEDG